MIFVNSQFGENMFEPGSAYVIVAHQACYPSAFGEWVLMLADVIG